MFIRLGEENVLRNKSNELKSEAFIYGKHCACVNDCKDGKKKGRCTDMASKPPGNNRLLTFNDIDIKVFHIQSYMQLFGRNKIQRP